MPYLVAGGVTVKVSLLEPVQVEYEEFGDQSPMFDGTERSTIRVRKRRWPSIQTALIPRADSDTLVAALVGTVVCSGTLMGGTVNCHAKDIKEAHVTLAAGEHVKVTFALREI